MHFHSDPIYKEEIPFFIRENLEWHGKLSVITGTVQNCLINNSSNYFTEIMDHRFIFI